MDTEPKAKRTRVRIVPLRAWEDRTYQVPRLSILPPFYKWVEVVEPSVGPGAECALNDVCATFEKPFDQVPRIGSIIELYPDLEGMVVASEGDAGLAVIVHEDRLPNWYHEPEVLQFSVSMRNAGWTPFPEDQVLKMSH